MTTKESIFDLYAQAYESQREHRMSLREYLEGCRGDSALYATTAERMITAIGEPEFVDTAKDPRLGRIFMNRTLKVYPAFKDFYGLEETIERIVGFFRHAAPLSAALSGKIRKDPYRRSIKLSRQVQKNHFGSKPSRNARMRANRIPELATFPPEQERLYGYDAEAVLRA